MTANVVAVTGLGVVSGLGTGIPSFTANLRAGRSAIRTVPNPITPVRSPLPQIDTDHIADTMDDAGRTRMQRVIYQAPSAAAAAVVAAAEAATDAKLTEVDPGRIGVVVAGSNLTNRLEQNAVLRYRAGQRVLPRHAVQMFDSDIAASVCETLGLFGEAWTAGAASASSAYAIALASRPIRTGELDAVVVVAAPSLLTDADLSAFAALGALYRGSVPEAGTLATSAWCRPFDQHAAGFVYGEAAAAVVLESTRAATGRGISIHGYIRGSALRSSATRSPAPDADTEAAVMTAAIHAAQLTPNDVDLINAHATSSRVGDRAEADAITRVFPKAAATPRINAIKALTGHCLTAAGMIGAVGTLIQLEQGWLHPNPHLANPIVDLSWVGPKAETWSGACALSNSFGFGGMYASIVLTVA